MTIPGPTLYQRTMSRYGDDFGVLVWERAETLLAEDPPALRDISDDYAEGLIEEAAQSLSDEADYDETAESLMPGRV